LRHPQLFTAQHVPVAGDDRRQEHETDEDDSESFFLHDHTIAAAPIARPLNPGDNSL
jgi:hypothetical protein